MHQHCIHGVYDIFSNLRLRIVIGIIKARVKTKYVSIDYKMLF